MAGKTYSFIDVTATYTNDLGQAFNLGYGSGANVNEEGISISRNGDKNTMTIGADGGGMHSLHADRSGSITVRLLQTSPMNKALQDEYNRQSRSSSTWGKGSFYIRMIASGDVITASNAAFKKLSDHGYKKDGGSIEWSFDCIEISQVLGTY